MSSPNSGAGVPQGDTARKWWVSICDPQQGDAAGRARLKRCRSATEALTIPAALGLARRLGAIREPLDRRRLEGVLGLARVLAHVTSDSAVTAMRAAGWGSFPGERREADADTGARPRLSEVRFRRLLQTEGGEEQVVMFTRLVRLIGGEVNIAALARDYLTWDWDTTRHRWAFEYYAAGAAAPASLQPTTGDEV